MQQRYIETSKTLYQTIKYLAKVHQVSLKRFYHNVMEWFLPRAFNDAVSYLPNFQNSHLLSLWLSDKHIVQINELANHHQISDAKVIYSALIHYIQRHQLI